MAIDSSNRDVVRKPRPLTQRQIIEMVRRAMEDTPSDNAASPKPDGPRRQPGRRVLDAAMAGGDPNGD